MLGEGLYAVCHPQQQTGSRQVVALPHQGADKQVAVQQMEGGKEGGGGSAAAPLQLSAHLKQLISSHLQARQQSTGTRGSSGNIRARMRTARGNHRCKCRAWMDGGMQLDVACSTFAWALWSACCR